MKPTCETYIRWMKDELAQELSMDCQEKLEAHLQECSSCRQEWQTFEMLTGEIRSLEDEPVPRHFFVFEEPSPTNRWWDARWILAAAAALFLVSLVLLVSQTNVTLADGSMTIAWGKSESTRSDQDEILKQELLAAFRQITLDENARLAASLRSEFLQVLESSESDQEEQLRQLISGTEYRLAGAIKTGDEKVQEELEESSFNMYRTIAFQRQKDLIQINRRISNLAAIDQVQAEQADTMMAAMIELASNRN